jgi:histone-arginine methyltransferase CARM1
LAANGLGDKICVIQARVEDTTLPEKADIIISEPMGFMLIHERMLESYITARQRFLKPGGRMFPTRGDIICAPFTDAALHAEQTSKVLFWENTSFFGMDLTALRGAAARDHFGQPVVGYVDVSTLLASSMTCATVDFASDLPSSLDTVSAQFDFLITKTGVCHGLAAWFDVAFVGTTATVILPTGPSSPGTHWYQCRALLCDPIAVNAGQRLVGTLLCKANARYSYDMTLSMTVKGSELTTENGLPVISVNTISLADQQYSYLTTNAAAATT